MCREDVKVGEILAHRCWWVGPDYNLRSFVAIWNFYDSIDTTWLPNKVLSADIHKSYGIHSLKLPDDSVRYKDFVFRGWTQFVTIAVGAIHIWGDTIEHEIGYRSQYAKIVTIEDVWSKDIPTGGLRINEELTAYFKGLYNV